MANNDELPEGYVKGIERVSNVVSYKFPFEGTYGETMYLNWLKKEGIEVDDYMEEACSVGTFIHLQMEHFIDGEPLDIDDPLFDIHRKEITNGITYFSKLMIKYPQSTWETEVVVRDENDRYQGSIDLVRVDKSTNTAYIYDWKTWGIAKKKFKLPNALKKNGDKLKKVALQLSLYAETYRQKGYNIGGIYVVWIHEDEAQEWRLFAEDHKQKVPNIRLWSSEEIDELLSSYLVRDQQIPKWITLTIKYNPMRISVQTPLVRENGTFVDYSKMEITLEGDDLDGRTPEENIGEAIRLQKLALGSYKA